MIDPTSYDWRGDNVSKEHRSKFKSNTWLYVLTAVVLLLVVAAMTLNIIGDKLWLA